ncbi:DUF1330 domain-containing protein [Gynuella sunshinyii]|uniref:DUF1330 domain-containing protein n=1 Tax=Gynuella sunshinyii YC6258 TaxID=1445510 RepID=A0A0C5V2C3_9GAMM|nr:DUF1330 domain-containing protein [Gynuella sunshinyii]AJQ93655.1 hypothetical protein YC6258_01607 [Gynuella sunshinyii YC6258]
MAVYLVAVVHITDPEAFERARNAASSATGEYGARFLARGSRDVVTRQLEIIEGELNPDHVTVIEYPSMEHVRAWLASDEYKMTRAQRQGAAEFSLFLLPGA